MILCSISWAAVIGRSFLSHSSSWKEVEKGPSFRLSTIKSLIGDIIPSLRDTKIICRLEIQEIWHLWILTIKSFVKNTFSNIYKLRFRSNILLILCHVFLFLNCDTTKLKIFMDVLCSLNSIASYPAAKSLMFLHEAEKPTYLYFLTWTSVLNWVINFSSISFGSIYTCGGAESWPSRGSSKI